MIDSQNHHITFLLQRVRQLESYLPVHNQPFNTGSQSLPATPRISADDQKTNCELNQKAIKHRLRDFLHTKSLPRLKDTYCGDILEILLELGKAVKSQLRQELRSRKLEDKLNFQDGTFDSAFKELKESRIIVSLDDEYSINKEYLVVAK